MKLFKFCWLFLLVVLLFCARSTASVYETNPVPGYIKKVVMRSTISCGGYYYYTFTCEHFLNWGESMEYNDYSTGDWDNRCDYTYTLDGISWIPLGGGSASLSKAGSQTYSGTDIFPYICTNAQESYRHAKWSVSLPDGISASVSASGGVSVSPSTVYNGDVITVTAGSSTGSYDLTVTPTGGVSPATVSGVVFSFGFGSSVEGSPSVETAGPGQVNVSLESVSAQSVNPNVLAGAQFRTYRDVSLTTTPAISLAATVRSSFQLSFSAETAVRVERIDAGFDGSGLSFNFQFISVSAASGLQCSGSTRGGLSIGGQSAELSAEVSANNSNLYWGIPDTYEAFTSLTASSTSPTWDFEPWNTRKSVEIKIVAASKSDSSNLQVPACYAILNSVQTALAPGATFEIQ